MVNELQAAKTSIDGTLLALAEPTRRRMVELLKRRPHCAGDLAAAFDMTAPAMSRHLRVLRKSGLIEEYSLEHDARIRMYRLRAERLSGLLAWLEELAAFWTEQLSAFKAHAERTHRKRPRR